MEIFALAKIIINSALLTLHFLYLHLTLCANKCIINVIRRKAVNIWR